jgi:hypothetical protein
MEDLSLDEVHQLIESAKAFKLGKTIQTKRWNKHKSRHTPNPGSY